MGQENGCKDPDGCRRKKVKFALSNDQALKQYGQNEYEKLKEKFKTEKFGWVSISAHAEQRMREKAISKTALCEVILEGDSIEYYKSGYGTEKITLWGNIRIAAKCYRPLHIVLKKRRYQDKWSIVTAYDPRSKAWRWNESFTERICFCEELEM